MCQCFILCLPYKESIQRISISKHRIVCIHPYANIACQTDCSESICPLYMNESDMRLIGVYFLSTSTSLPYIGKESRVTLFLVRFWPQIGQKMIKIWWNWPKKYLKIGGGYFCARPPPKAAAARLYAPKSKTSASLLGLGYFFAIIQSNFALCHFTPIRQPNSLFFMLFNIF